MQIIQEPKKVAYEINGILKKRKKRSVCSMFKNSVWIFVEKNI
jgi:hypothetical protein